MKKILVVAFVATCLCSMPGWVMASELELPSQSYQLYQPMLLADLAVIPAPTNVTVAGVDTGVSDSWLKTEWSTLSASSNFHLLDNMTAATFIDFSQGKAQVLAGGSTSFYKVHHIGLDLGVVKPIFESAGAYPIVGAKLYLGELAQKYTPSFYTFVNNLVPQYSILSNATIGGWGARDFYAAAWVGGVYTGLQFGGANVAE